MCRRRRCHHQVRTSRSRCGIKTFRISLARPFLSPSHLPEFKPRPKRKEKCKTLQSGPPTMANGPPAAVRFICSIWGTGRRMIESKRVESPCRLFGCDCEPGEFLFCSPTRASFVARVRGLFLCHCHLFRVQAAATSRPKRPQTSIGRRGLWRRRREVMSLIYRGN